MVICKNELWVCTQAFLLYSHKSYQWPWLSAQAASDVSIQAAFADVLY